VAIAGVEIGAQRIEVERDVAGRMGAIDHREDAALPGLEDRPLDWEDQRRWRRDVAQEQYPRAIGKAGEDGVGEGLFGDERHRRLDRRDFGAGAAGNVGPGLFECRVLVVSGQDLVAGLEVERLRDDVQSLGSVDEAHDIVRTGAEAGGERDAGDAHPLGQLAAEESYRLAFELKLPGLIGLEHRTRAGAERAVVEEDDILAQEEMPGEVQGQVSGLSK
jgi:hypothetical protein